MIKILFVCLGNICRSPAAEGVLRARLETSGLTDCIAVDSAATSAWNVGLPPDPRSIDACRRRGIDISFLRARQVAPADFRQFEYVLAMDRRNHADLFALCPPGHQKRLRLFLDLAPAAGRREIPDPYAFGMDAFEEMLDLIEIGCDGLLHHLRLAHFGAGSPA